MVVVHTGLVIARYAHTRAREGVPDAGGGSGTALSI